jgi:hypothetical protein
MRRMLSSVIVGVLALGTLPAGAAMECRVLPDDTPLCREAVWFTSGDLPMGNLAAPADSYPSWGAEPPEDTTGSLSLTSGNVSVHDQFNRPITGVAFQGTFAGALDALLVELFLLDPQPPGCEVFSCSPTNGGTAVQATLWSGDTRIVRAWKVIDYADTGVQHTLAFALDGLHERMLAAGLDPSGDERDLRLEIESATNNHDPLLAYRYGSADAPSGMVFNPAEAELTDVPVLVER